MKVIGEHDRRSGWVTCVIDGRWCEAKIRPKRNANRGKYGRIIKLEIGKKDRIDHRESHTDQICFRYDRGVIFDNAPAGMPSTIIKKLSNLDVIGG